MLHRKTALTPHLYLENQHPHNDYKYNLFPKFKRHRHSTFPCTHVVKNQMSHELEIKDKELIFITLLVLVCAYLDLEFSTAVYDISITNKKAC